MANIDTTADWTAVDWLEAEKAWLDWRTAVVHGYDVQTQAMFERAWAAGLLESAAGCARFQYDADSPRSNALLPVSQPANVRGRANLVRFQVAIGGVGAISGPHSELGYEPYYLWSAKDDQDVEAVWRATGAFVGLAQFGELGSGLVVPALRALLNRARRPGKKRRSRRSQALTL